MRQGSRPWRSRGCHLWWQSAAIEWNRLFNDSYIRALMRRASPISLLSGLHFSGFSTANEFLEFCRIARTLHRYFRGSRFQFVKVIRRKLNVDGSEVLFKPME